MNTLVIVLVALLITVPLVSLFIPTVIKGHREKKRTDALLAEQALSAGSTPQTLPLDVVPMATVDR